MTAGTMQIFSFDRKKCFHPVIIKQTNEEKRKKKRKQTVMNLGGRFSCV